MERIQKNLQRTSKSEKGITLIALVITIIILIILSTITINTAFGGGGLIDRIRGVGESVNQITSEGQSDIDALKDEYASMMGEGKSGVANAKDSGEPFNATTSVIDDLINFITIPKGFKISADSGTKVEEGIVIEDGSGNQFVWIPVGEYNVTEGVDSDGTVDGKMTNELSRRTFSADGATLVDGDSVINSLFYGEGDSRAVATNIDQFKISVDRYNGFYIGRFKQGEGNVCKKEVLPLIAKRDEAMSKCEEMYSANLSVTSELISGYAWDTVLNYICQTNADGYGLAATADSNRQNNVYNNIYNIIANDSEWTTEYCSWQNRPTVYRGGYYSAASMRADSLSDEDLMDGSGFNFRVQLYVK